ncbi:rRNA pseudouridine synthase [Candidatus Woesearchaeota archaeon]|nr:rRNA pseudouridine synthase [Candidatus Woesearchaeota archaeon]
MLMRVQKILADAGIASRRKCEELIAQGKVKVNGKPIKLGDKADPEKDNITLEGKLITSETKKIYLIINKPWGYVTTVSEPFGMKKVTDLIPVKERIFPVGRLDRYSDGLLLLTNDGELAHKLTHPSFGVFKTYIVKLDKPITEDEVRTLAEGIIIDGRKVELTEILVLGANRVQVKLHEGRKHIVRRLFEYMKYKVTKLSRIQFGPLTLGALKVGQWRYLNEKEVEMLKKAVKN